MPKLGKEAYIVQLISTQTKIKPEDVLDVLKVLSECLAEAFFDQEPAEKQEVSFGFVTIYWEMTGFGPGIFFKPTDAFKRHSVTLKLKGRTPFAANLYKKMMQKSKDRIAQRIANENDLNKPKKQKSAPQTAEYAQKANQNRRNLKEKRKLKKKMLSDSKIRIGEKQTENSSPTE